METAPAVLINKFKLKERLSVFGNYKSLKPLIYNIHIAHTVVYVVTSIYMHFNSKIWEL